ncbi:MAG: hypothetical protein WC995_13455, partial [Lysobacteraceae bacterium]
SWSTPSSTSWVSAAAAAVPEPPVTPAYPRRQLREKKGPKGPFFLVCPAGYTDLEMKTPVQIDRHCCPVSQKQYLPRKHTEKHGRY